MRLAILPLLLIGAAAPLFAQLRPGPTGGDPRIQTVVFDPRQVVQLQVASGYELTLEFAPDERIETVAVGDSSAWQVTPNKRSDHLFIKSVRSGVTTNMTVVTDSRTYSFELMPAYGPTPDMAFTVRFEFPPSVAAVPISATDGKATPELGRYKLSGDKALRPQAIDDDGVHTYIEWGKDQDIPAIFALDEKGQESLVNGAMRSHRFVIDSVSNRLIFRVDRKKAFATRLPLGKGL